MKTKEGMPMPGAKRENQNQPSGDKEKKHLVLPKIEKIIPKEGKSSGEKTGHEGHTKLTKAKSIKK